MSGTIHSNVVSNTVLFRIRVAILTLITAQVTWQVVEEGVSYFYELTNWNWCLNLMYFLLACTKLGPQQSVYFKFFFANSIAIAPIVSVLFWGFQANAIVIGGTLAHTFNVIFPFLDLYLSKTRINYVWVLAPLLVSTLYMIMVILWHLLLHVPWPYTYLQTVNNGKEFGIVWLNTFALCAGIWLLILLTHFVGMKICDLRDWYTAKNAVEDDDEATVMAGDKSDLEDIKDEDNINYSVSISIDTKDEY